MNTLRIRIRCLALTMVGLLATWTSANAQAPASGSFAAIAFSASTREYAWSHGYPTREAAQQKALTTLNMTDGKIVQTCWNGYHCALAIGPTGAYGHACGATAREAQELALRECRKWDANAKIKICVFSGFPLFGANQGWNNNKGNRCGRCGWVVGAFESMCSSCLADQDRYNRRP